MRKAFTALILALALAGCYESRDQLILTGDGETPFGREAHYTSEKWNDTMRHWEASDPGSILRLGDHYMQFENDDAAQAKSVTVKSIGGGLYIAMESPPEQASGGSYHYDLLRIQGDTVLQYGLACDSADEKFVAQKLIDSWSAAPPFGNTCVVSDFDKMARVFRQLSNGQPQGRYSVKRER